MPGRERGVTLLELLIAMAMGAVLVLGVLAVWRESQNAYLEGAEATDVQQSLRVAMEQMVRIIRNAGTNPTNAANVDAFSQAGDECLRVEADLRGNQDGTPPDGDSNDPGERIRFDWDRNSRALRQQDQGGPEDLALKIVANPGNIPIFQYFDANGAPIPTGGGCGMSQPNRASIRRVRITLTAQGTVQGQTVTRTLVSEVRPRNLP